MAANQNLAPRAPVAPRRRVRRPKPPPPNWREQVVTLSGLNVIAGLWLIVAPWALGYAGADPRWDDVAFGASVALLALIRLGGRFREVGWSLINATIGVWLFIAAFTIDVSGAAATNDIIVGVIVFLLACGSARATP